MTGPRAAAAGPPDRITAALPALLDRRPRRTVRYTLRESAKEPPAPAKDTRGKTGKGPQS